MDELRIGQLAKEMVAEQLRLLADPCAAAAQVVRQTLSAALSGEPVGGTPPERVIEDTVKGAMTALLLADHSLSKGAIMMIEAVHDVANDCQLDTTESMRAALRGLADLRRFVTPEKVDEVRIAIDQRYMGAGELFADYLRQETLQETAIAETEAGLEVGLEQEGI